jgi:hypothetical protein
LFIQLYYLDWDLQRLKRSFDLQGVRSWQTEFLTSTSLGVNGSHPHWISLQLSGIFNYKNMVIAFRIIKWLLITVRRKIIPSFAVFVIKDPAQLEGDSMRMGPVHPEAGRGQELCLSATDPLEVKWPLQPLEVSVQVIEL